jgi:hypothetical protein
LRTQHQDQSLDLPPGFQDGIASDVWEQLESEDKLGCARGVVWAILCEAALAAVAVACWKFHLWTR